MTDEITKCPCCDHRLDVFFLPNKDGTNDQKRFGYDCPPDDGGCGWISDIMEAKEEKKND